MEKLDFQPSWPISLRRIRTQAEWKVETHMIRARRPTSSSTRSFISLAALLVNVIARIEPGWARRWEISQAIRRVSTRVLPEPAPATTSSGAPAWTTAARCGSLRPASRSSALGRGRAAAGVAGSRPGIGKVSLISPTTLRRRGDSPIGHQDGAPGCHHW